MIHKGFSILISTLKNRNYSYRDQNNASAFKEPQDRDCILGVIRIVMWTHYGSDSFRVIIYRFCGKNFKLIYN